MKSDNLTNSNFVIILLAAATYFVAGRLGLLLAIPPGYATAVWPAAGVALAAVLLRGNVACVGILLGSFFVNLSMGFDDSTPEKFIQSLPVPFAIGCGAALQAFVGGLLIRVFISASPTLDSIRSVALFVFLGAAVSSMVNASIGTGTLLLAGIIAPDNYLFNWVTWWTGDAIGILIFTILILTLFSENKDVWHTRRFTVAIPLSISFIVIVVMFFLASQWETSKQNSIFQRKAEKLYHSLELAIAGPEEVLRAIASFMRGSDLVTREEFATFVQWPLENQVGIHALAWVPYVMHKERADMERLAASDGFSEFTFTELVDEKIQPSRIKASYYPVFYVEPLKGNEKALGLDLGSNKARKEAIDLAIQTRGVTSTESITLVQESGNQKAIIMFLPYFSTDYPDKLLGLFDVVIRTGDLVRAVISDELIDGVVMTLTEYGENGEPAVLLDTTQFWPDSVAGNKVDQFTWQKNLDVGNRAWGVSIVASQDLLTASRTLVPWAILAGGLLFSGLLGVFLLYVTGATYRAKKSALELSDTLHDLQETQSQLVESEKLASLGSMMSGLAHELNTPIGIAITAISTIGDRVKPLTEKLANKKAKESDLNSFFALATEASAIAQGNLNRAAQLVKSYRDVAVDRATDEVRKINLADYLGEILIYLRPSYKNSGHEIKLDCAANISIITAPGGFSQVLINLLNNSFTHAFDAGVNGNILIKVEAGQEEICLTYTDDGKGIPENDLEKVFEPYFSTRKSSGGTGLGLHLVKKIVEEKLQGRIALISNDGDGVQIEIKLPREIS